MKRMRVHFVGAPFFVPAAADSLQARFAATGYNTGNLLIGDAVARLLDVDIVSSGTMVNIRNLNDTIDVLVIPAANFLSPVMDLSWLLPIVEGTNHRILMVGVGAQFPTTRIADAQLPEIALRLMRAISDRSQSISVRGQFTADVLAKFGIKNTRVTGCPSLFRLGKEKLLIRTPSPDSFRPVFNGSSNVLKHASSAEEARKAELKLLRLAMELEAPYVLQNELPEMQVAARDKKGASGCEATLHNLGADIKLDHYLNYIREHAKTFFRADRWAEFIARHDIVIGTRFHGNIIALSQGLPAAFIAHDSRTVELCEALRIPFIALKQFADTDLRQVVEALDFSKMEKHFPAVRKNLASFFEENQVPHRLQGDAENEIRQAAQSIAARFVQVQDAENGLGLERREDDTWLAELNKFLGHDKSSPLADLGDEFPARKFSPATADEVSFGKLSPLASESPWSAVARICSEKRQAYSGLISKRTDFAVGSNQFTFWLKDGAIAVEVDNTGFKSGLCPPLGKWSFVAVSASAQEADIFLGVGGRVEHEDRAGLCTGACGHDLPLTIGRLGNNFPGAISEICLFSRKLSAFEMEQICSGSVEARQVPGLAFMWAPSKDGDVDLVSGTAASVIGTKIVSFRVKATQPPKQSKDQSSDGLVRKALHRLGLFKSPRRLKNSSPSPNS
ncbi:MAG: polysaccharide pyruvyl transferase family protein [Acidobacteria bacterium]|nr:polysaccharide pyruvyl transferase family protein [Acidobacteriota bacterium]